jgi:hypothetical protein
MAGNRFNIPTFDLDLLNWANNAKAYNANRARERQQDWNNIFGAAAGLGSQIRAEKEAEKAREAAAKAAALREKHQDVQAQLQREFQAEEAEKARKFQAAQNAENRKAQQDYNMALRGIEQAKLENKEKDAAQILYGNLLAKETNTPGEEAQMRQIETKWQDIGKYKDAEGKEHLMRDDVNAQRAAKANKDYEFALFKAGLPTTFNKKNPKEQTIFAIKNGKFSDGTPFTEAQRTELLDYVNNVKDQKTKTGEAVQGAIANAAAKSTTEKIDDAKAKEESKQYVGSNSLKWNKIPPEIKKHLKLNSTTGKIEEK